MDHYDHANRETKTRSSADIVVPIITEILAPRSVVDVGCGTGTWLSGLKAQGVDTVLGLDGDWVNPEHLQIKETEFRVCSLLSPPDLGREFDLAISLEVAEHLPADQAQEFVSYLTRLAPAVLFSAAIPGQGHPLHVNEQWPEYWFSAFSELGYTVFDCIRGQVWGNPSVRSWYQQNTFLYVCKDAVRRYPGLLNADPGFSCRRIVHPELYLGKAHQAGKKRRVLHLLRELAVALRRALRRRLGMV